MPRPQPGLQTRFTVILRTSTSTPPPLNETITTDVVMWGSTLALSTNPPSHPINHQPAAPVPTATMFIFSTDPCNREKGRRQKKMKIKCGVKMKKGMMALGTSFGQDYRKLNFIVNGLQLNGEEMAGISRTS